MKNKEHNLFKTAMSSTFSFLFLLTLLLSSSCIDVNSPSDVANISLSSIQEDTQQNRSDPFDLNPSNYVKWKSSATYIGGDYVYHNNKEYRAKWWVRGKNPETCGQWGVWALHKDISNVKVVNTRAQSNGTISPSGKKLYKTGDNVTVTIQANSGYKIDRVEVDGNSVGAVSSHSFTNLSDHHSVEAFFIQNSGASYTIVASARANGTINPSGNISVNKGANKSFTITANNGYLVDYLLIDGSQISARTSYAFNNVSSDHTIEAVFKIVQATTHIISAFSSSNGTINPAGDVVVNNGSTKTFTLTPDNGYEIENLTVDGQSLTPTSTYTFTNITENHALGVTFRRITNNFTITASTGSNGSISPSGAVTVPEGINKSFTITPNSGYQIDKVLVDGQNIGAVTTYRFDNIRENHTIRATFKVTTTTHIISAFSSSNGTISPAGDIVVNNGSNKTFTLTPDNGYEIENLTVDGQSLTPTPTYTFTNITENHALGVTFRRITNNFTITASSGSNGSISPSGNITVTSGSNKTFTFSASSGYEIDYIKVDGSNIGVQTSYSFNNITRNHTISAYFKASGGSICDGVPDWSSSQSWTSYRIGDLKVNNNKLWRCKSVGYSYFEPSGAWGRFGWTFVGNCN